MRSVMILLYIKAKAIMVALIILFDINSRNLFSGRQVKLEGRTRGREMLSEVADRPSSL